MKLLIKNLTFWSIIGNIILIATIIIMAVIWNKHECPKQTKPELDETYINNTKTINDAKTNDDFDTLSLKYFGFKPTRESN